MFQFHGTDGKGLRDRNVFRAQRCCNAYDEHANLGRMRLPPTTVGVRTFHTKTRILKNPYASSAKILMRDILGILFLSACQPSLLVGAGTESRKEGCSEPLAILPFLLANPHPGNITPPPPAKSLFLSTLASLFQLTPVSGELPPAAPGNRPQSAPGR